MAAESITGLSTMENDIKMLSSEKQIIENESDKLFKMSVADMEKEREGLSNELKDTIEKCNILSSELEKAMLSKKEVQTLLEENQKLKNDNLTLLTEHDNLKARLQNLDMEYSKLRETITDTKAENESLIKEKHLVESKIQQLEMDIEGLTLEKQKLADNLKMKLNTAAQEKEISTSKHSKCLDELKMARSKVTELENELESTKRVLNGTIMDLQNENNFATSEIKRLETFVNNVKSQLEQQLAKTTDMQKNNEALVLVISNLQNEIIEIQAEKNEVVTTFLDLESKLEEEAQQISNLQETIKDLETTKIDLHNEVIVHQEEKTTSLAQLQQVEDSLKDLENTNSDMRKTNEDLLLANSKLQNEIIEVQGEKSELETKLEEKTHQISNLQETIMDLEAAMIDLQTEVTVHQEQKATALAQLQQVDASLKNLENQLDQQRKKNSDMTNDIARLDKQLVDVRRSLHAKIVALHKEKDATLLELQKSQAFVTDFENVIEQQNEQFSSQQQANNELQKTIYTLTKESEQDRTKLQEEVARLDKQLVELRRSLHAKITALHEYKDATLRQLQESQASVRNFESVIEVQNEKISYLQQNNDELQKIICTLIEESEQGKTKLQEDLKDMTNKNIAWLEKQLVEMRRTHHAKITALHKEKDAALLELHASQASARNSENVVEQQNEKISSIQQDKDELQKTIYTLTHELDQAKAKLQEEVSRLDKQLMEVRRSLHAKIVALHEEKDVTLLELQKSQASMRNFESVVGEQNEKISALQRENDGLQKTIYTSSEDSEQAKAKFQEELARSNKQLVDVRKSLHAKIAALHQEKDASLLELQKYQASVRNFECVVKIKNENILSLEQANDELEKTIYTLSQESDQAKATLQEEVSMFDKQLVEVRRSLHTKITALNEGKDAALLELHVSQASVRNFENMIEQQNEEFLSQQQANDELQKTIYTLTKESEQAKSKLKEEVASLEKQLVELRRSLHTKITALHEDKDVTLLQLQESQASVRNFESLIEVQNEKISYIQQNNDELQKIICTLTEESEQGKAKLQEDLKDMTNKNIAWLEKQLVEMRRTLHAKIAALHQEKDAALLELHASQTSVRNSKSVVEQQNEKISSLQQDKDELQKTIYTLTYELDQAKAKLQEEVSRLDKQLVEVRRSLHAKIVALHEENDVTLLKLQKSQAAMRNFESVVGQQNDKISFLQRESDELQKTIYTSSEDSEHVKAKFQEELARSNKQLVDVRKSLQAKITALHQEKDASLLKLQKYQASVRNFECVVEEQNDNILSLQQANDELQRTVCILTEELEQVKAKLQEEVTSATNNVCILEKQLVEVRRSLQGKIVALHQEKDTTLLELQASQASVRNFESVVEEQNEGISYLQQAHDDLQKIICTLTEESEQGKANLLEELKHLTNNNISRLEKQLVEVRRSLHAKIAALHEEKDATLLDLHASQASVRNFESMVEEQKTKIMSLQQDNDELQKIIYTLIEESEQGKAKLQEEAKAMANNIVVLEKQLVEVRKSLHAKMAALHEDKDATLLELQATQAFIRNLESVVEEQNENISSLQEANDELKKTICSVIEESERAKVKQLDEVKTIQEEKDIVITRLKQSESYIKNLENEVARLIKEISVQLENNSKLDKHLEETALKVSNLNEKLEKSQAEMASHIDDMSLEIKELEDTINALSSQKTKVEEDLKMLVEACSGNMSKMKEFEDTVKQRITNDVTRFRPLHQSLKEVLSRYQKLQYAYDELSARTSRFEVLKQNQMEQVDKIRQLKEEKLNTFMENTKLHKHVQDLEIQLQHVKQKLMENKWKEDRFAATLETSQAEIQNLEQLVSLLEETLQEIKEHAESGVFSMVEQLDKLESSFSQGFPRFVYRSSASNEELKVLRKKLHGHLDEQKELLKKKDGLAIRLRNKEKVLSEMVRNDAEERILEKKVEEKESGEERTNNTSKRWPILRRRKWRRNSYSC